MTCTCSIAVLIPCYNEATAISQVIREFQLHLPTANIYVYDNNSTDGTPNIAREAGAYVAEESYQGKGHVIRRMFADIDADIYVLVDGDGTYHAPSAPAMVDLLLRDRLDMVVGVRKHNQADAYRSGHILGNLMLTRFLSALFNKGQFTDILSGYRVFSRQFVKSFPALAQGFETETELTVHALELYMPVSELETPYGARLAGSTSKLNTYRDGFRILGTILHLFEKERPLSFFGLIFIFFTYIGSATRDSFGGDLSRNKPGATHTHRCRGGWTSDIGSCKPNGWINHGFCGTRSPRDEAAFLSLDPSAPLQLE